MPLKTYEIGSITGKGETKAKAKENALQNAADALSKEYAPIIVIVRDKLAVIYQTPHGYAITSNISRTNMQEYAKREDCAILDYRAKCVTLCGETNLQTIIGDTLLNLAEASWDGVSHEEAVPFDAEEYPHQAREYRSYILWQARHAEAKKQGFDDNEAYMIASNAHQKLGFTTEQLEKVKAVFDKIQPVKEF